MTSILRFNYAWGLVRSHYRDDQRRGVELFREIFHEDRERQRECAYYLALGYYRLGNYKTAKYGEYYTGELISAFMCASY